MKVLKQGHLYELDSLEGTNPQKLQFIEKEMKVFPADNPAQLGEAKFVTVNDGTTNEEVLLMLIDRTRTLGDKLPSKENSIALTKLEEALMWFHKRTEIRMKQGVENTPFNHKQKGNKMTTTEAWEISDFMKEVHKSLYGNTVEMGSIFRGGNIGMVVLALEIKDASIRISESINYLATKIEGNKNDKANNGEDIS